MEGGVEGVEDVDREGLDLGRPRILLLVGSDLVSQMKVDIS